MTNPTSSTTSPINLTGLEQAVAQAAAIGKQLVGDRHHGRSQFAAGIRSNLDHAAELVAEHKKWSAANPGAPVS